MQSANAHAIRTLDTLQFGVPGTGAAFLIDAPMPVLIEAGTARAAHHLLEQLEGQPPQLIFLTHVHLDHAGAAGHMLQQFTSAKVGVHIRGLRHLEHPDRLVNGVRRASPDVFPLYGEPLPIPADRLFALAGGERFDLGDGFVLEVVATPGHAPHHLCYFEHRTGTLFTGDALGNWNLAVNVPLTVPPRFDLDQELASLRRMRRLKPRRLAFTHFGISNTPARELDRYECELVSWFEKLRHLARTLSDDAIVASILGEPGKRGLSALDQPLVEMCIRGGLLSLACKR